MVSLNKALLGPYFLGGGGLGGCTLGSHDIRFRNSSETFTCHWPAGRGVLASPKFTWPVKLGRAPKGNSSTSTLDFQVLLLLVSGRGVPFFVYLGFLYMIFLIICFIRIPYHGD